MFATPSRCIITGNFALSPVMQFKDGFEVLKFLILFHQKWAHFIFSPTL
jgi:hypothetical protein